MRWTKMAFISAEAISLLFEDFLKKKHTKPMIKFGGLR